MRIAVVSQEYPPETAKGGIGTQAFAKARGLARRGHEVHVISRSTSSQRQERLDGDVRVVRVGAPRLEAHTEVADWVAYSAEVAAEVATVHARAPLDLVEFPEWGCEAYVHLLNRTEWNRIPTAIHLHGPLAMLAQTLGWPEPGSAFHREAIHLEGTCLRMADVVYSSSACSAAWCAREYGLNREEIPVLHTGVDTRHFSPRDGAARDNARPTVVFAGKVTWNKGVLELLEAAIRVAPSFPGLRVRMLGRGDKHVVDKLRQRAAESGQADLLELPGFVDRQRLPDELAQAHVFAAPSRYEGGPGFVYLEAMACGVPVVACAGSGAAEVVVPGENGLLVQPGDVPALADALRTLLGGAREAMARRARSYALEHADGERCLDKIDAFFRSVTDRSKGTAG